VACYVDFLVRYERRVRGRLYWAHLWTDGDLPELHEFAERIGLRPKWFVNDPVLPHYDVTPGLRRRAIHQGAKEYSLLAWFRERYRWRQERLAGL
jgi:hypothetical protein